MIRQKTWPTGEQEGVLIFPTYLYIENFKNLKPISVLLGRKVPLVTVYQDFSSRHYSAKNMAASGGGGGGGGGIVPIYL